MSESKKKPEAFASPAAEAFLVRIWREPSQRSMAPDVRISAKQLRTGELRHFAEIEDLDPYLMSKM